MEVFSSLAHGFAVAFTPGNLVAVLVGVLIGMAVGVLPGLGPGATIALLLPLTYVLPTDAAIIMLAGIYYGAYYGGTVTSVLIRLPGEAASVVTAIDGYEMAKQGRAGAALGISAIGSFVGGMFAVAGLAFFAPSVARFALTLGPPEYAVLAGAGLFIVSAVGGASVWKSLVSAGAGLFVATIGIDAVSGQARFTGDSANLLSGIDFIPVTMGLFGLGDILHHLETSGKLNQVIAKVKGVWPSRKDIKDSSGSIVRGSVLGFLLGLVPGGGGIVASMASYAMEKKVSKNPEEFGRGAIAGVAGPETANNSGSTAAFVPLLTLGLPANVVLALMYGALLIQGVQPGPNLINERPDVFWGVIASMVIGNGILLVLSIPFVRVFAQLVRVRLGILSAVILVVTMVGAYSVNNNVFDMGVLLVFGAIGYLMRKTGFSPGPFVMAMVIGPLLESSFRQSMILSQGDLTIFVTRPVSGTVLAMFAVLIVASYFWSKRPTRALETDSV